MNKTIVQRLAPFLAFFAAAFISRMVWQAIEKMVLVRLGYWFWLWDSTNDLKNMDLIRLIASICRYSLPLLFGLTAFGWIRQKARQQHEKESTQAIKKNV
jgi:hypothetical protein